jgi:hypothetical protein
MSSLKASRRGRSGRLVDVFGWQERLDYIEAP